jgi:TRAP-type mannitol/chloroaromatic compound transport system permease small subunit
MQGLAATVDWINERVGRFAALLILPGIFIMLYEVVARYVFNAPTVWVNESVQILFGFYFLLGGAYTLLHRGHVRVDLLLQGLSPRGMRRANVFGLAVSIFYLSALLWFSGLQALDSIAYLERAESAWAPYIFPVIAAAPLAAALLILQALSLIVREYRAGPPPVGKGDEDGGIVS